MAEHAIPLTVYGHLHSQQIDSRAEEGYVREINQRNVFVDENLGFTPDHIRELQLVLNLPRQNHQTYQGYLSIFQSNIEDEEPADLRNRASRYALIQGLQKQALIADYPSTEEDSVAEVEESHQTLADLVNVSVFGNFSSEASIDELLFMWRLYFTEESATTDRREAQMLHVIEEDAKGNSDDANYFFQVGAEHLVGLQRSTRQHRRFAPKYVVEQPYIFTYDSKVRAAFVKGKDPDNALVARAMLETILAALFFAQHSIQTKTEEAMRRLFLKRVVENLSYEEIRQLFFHNPGDGQEAFSQNVRNILPQITIQFGRQAGQTLLQAFPQQMARMESVLDKIINS